MNEKSSMLFRGREPTTLRFGTSGLRGLVTDITDLEAYINTRGFLDYLFDIGDAAPDDIICIAGDLRPSTDSPERSIMRAVARAVVDAGLHVDHVGKLPTPALTCYAVETGRPSVMVTGSHIPFDRNGIKFNKRSGEVLKQDETDILAAVDRARRREYEKPVEDSPFGDDGMFKAGKSQDLPPLNEEARKAYLKRYVDFFPPGALAGKRIVFFQHSAVGRDLLVELFRELGAEVRAAGRSDTFIAIDTEDITEERLQSMQEMVDEVWQQYGPVDALVSTDGDSDRPLVVGITQKGKARFFGGDLLGIVVAEYLEARNVAIPVSVNDAADLQLGKRGIRPIKTAIGSPFVIKGMQDIESTGGDRIVGWEANGGFLVGSEIEKEGKKLSALPTRDAALPIAAVLHAAVESRCTLVELFSRLPKRFSKAGLIDQFPQETGHRLVRRFSPRDAEQVDFVDDRIVLKRADGTCEEAADDEATRLRAIQAELQSHFNAQAGFGRVTGINVVDGARIYFDNGDIAHIRPSGNAPQLRLYAVADTQERANEIVRMGIREPDGLLRKLEKNSRTRDM
jgi:phosphomannomutase